MKKYFLLLLFTAISYAQTNGVTKLKITANPEKTAATRVVVQDAATGEVGYVNKTTIVTLDATTTTTGKIQLAGDLGGTATAPTVPALLTKEPTIASGTISQYYRGDKTWQTLDKTAVGLSNVDNTSDLNKPISTATQTALNLKENTANKNTANGYAGLGSDGKLISNQLPAITITDTFVVGSQSAMLALTAETGDVAVRTDLSKSYILKGSNPAVLGDWQELLSPVDGVTSVFGRVGSVVANTGDYTTAQVTETTNKKYQTDAQALYNDATSSIQTQLNAKEPSISAPGTVGSYWRGNKTWATLDTSVIPENGALFFTNARAKTAVTGDSGTLNYLSKFTSSGTIGNSLIYDNGSGIGIGTTAPSDGKLQVAGSSQLGNTIAQTYFGVGAAATKVTSNGSYAIGIDAADGSTERMRITSAGNVGIGTTAPDGKLNVYTGASVTNATAFNVGDGSNSLKYIPYTGAGSYNDLSVAGGGLLLGNINSKLAIGTWNGTAIQFGPTNTLISGNVGISNSNPIAKLHIDASGWALNGATVSRIMQKNIGSASDYEQHIILLHPIWNGSNIDFNKCSGKIYATRGGTSMGLINDTYNIETASAYNADTGEVNSTHGYGRLYTCIYGGVKYLALLPDYRTSAVEYNFDGYTKSTGERLKVVSYRLSNTGTVLNSEVYNSLTLYTPGTTYFNGPILTDNTVTATGFFQSSDLRLKDVISRDGDVIKYKWKDKRDDKIHIGYVAQEVQKENPDQVNADDKGILSVNYIEILVEKIRKLEKEIDLLKAK